MKRRLFLFGWSLLWTLGLPFILLYIRRRARKDPGYGAQLGERFGRYVSVIKSDIWIHAVSLGEVRSAVPLIQALTARGDKVVLTCFTPAGRREAQRIFACEIKDLNIAVVWVPFEYRAAYRRFFRAFRPRLGLAMEIEIWPRMVFAAKAAGVPLLMCNAQYPTRSMARDAKGWGLRHEVMRGFAGALVKSDLQRQRFASVGVPNIAVTGELRFDQPIPPHLEAAGRALRDALRRGRPIVTIASAIEGEDDLYINMIRALLDQPGSPLFVYVPRAPERFDTVAQMLTAADITVLRRSRALPDSLMPPDNLPATDVLLGDSLGEMYAYLAIADRVVVGGGFSPKGAHNIIESLALKRPVIVGPHTHTIEYPAEEAIAAGVCHRVPPEGLVRAVSRLGGAHARSDLSLLSGPRGRDRENHGSDRSLASTQPLIQLILQQKLRDLKVERAVHVLAPLGGDDIGQDPPVIKAGGAPQILRRKDVNNAHMLINQRRCLPGQNPAGQGLGHLQTAVGARLDQVEIGIFSGRADGHDHVRTFGIEQGQRPVDVLWQPKGGGHVKIDEGRHRPDHPVADRQGMLPHGEFARAVAGQFGRTKPHFQSAARHRPVIDLRLVS